MVSNRQLKMFAAAMGIVAAGTAVAVGAMANNGSTEAQNWIQSPMETGVTVTQSEPGNTPEVKEATPPFTFTTPEGFAVPH